ncbi:preprotein translocase subunit YajC [Candidatus Albibeggiatoa sp. nov. BB20]|uniref:preprotein translocase subunit YajC n=1 Tax=Candidatus Albibeggiatoa sp. nov. BB20 TaxID=3162723 RepID=UPI00336572FB
MDFLIAAAHAEGATATQGGGFASFIPLVILIVVFYFLLIRPQQQRVKDHNNMVTSLQKGDEIVTNGGLLGRIIDIGENFIQIQIAQNTEVKIQRQAVSSIMPKGTMKNL